MLLLCAVMLLCICLGSVPVRLSETIRTVFSAIFSSTPYRGTHANIILNIRLPRVFNTALCGASLSLCGAAMQGILRNPLADGSTLGVSSGASLGALLSIAFGIRIPFLGVEGTVPMAVFFAFCSLLLIMFLTYSLDRTLSTNSIILIGVIYSMFVSSVLTLIVSFSGEKLRSITFWTMGSLSGTDFGHTRLLLCALIVCGIPILRCATELNAFSMGEFNARHIGVNVKRIKLIVMIFVSILIGVCVSVSGTIGFVGLVTPHMTRLIVGPDHKQLLPASLFSGAVFLLLSDLVARTVLSPIELSVGVVTSLIGAVSFLFIFRRSGRKTHAQY